MVNVTLSQLARLSFNEISEWAKVCLDNCSYSEYSGLGLLTIIVTHITTSLGLVCLS